MTIWETLTMPIRTMISNSQENFTLHRNYVLKDPIIDIVFLSNRRHYNTFGKCDNCNFRVHKSLLQLMAHHQLVECNEEVYKDFLQSVKMYTVKAKDICSSICSKKKSTLP